MIVVDASVAVKWFLPEANATEAAALFEAKDSALVGPDILAVEVNAAFVRGANMVKENHVDALIKLAKFLSMLEAGDVSIMRTEPVQLHHAARLAIDIGHPLKDCIYLALAMELDCTLVTADTRFAERAKGVWDQVRVLGG